MRHELEACPVQCPYCWQSFDLLVDCSVDQQEFIEDCEVCCRPIVFTVRIGADGLPMVTAQHEDETP